LEWHARGDVFRKALKTMPKFLEASIDAARARVCFTDGSPFDQLPGQVGGSQFEGLSIGKVPAPPNEHPAAGAQAESLCDLGRCLLGTDLENFHFGLTTLRFHLSKESGLTRDPMTSSEAVRTEANDRGPAPNEWSTAMLDVNEALSAEQSDWLSDGSPGCTVLIHQFGLRGKPWPGHKLSLEDLPA
jgi:hypothetical protein